MLCLYPELKGERSKVQDLLEQCDFEVMEKDKKDYAVGGSFTGDMDTILARPYR